MPKVSGCLFVLIFFTLAASAQSVPQGTYIPDVPAAPAAPAPVKKSQSPDFSLSAVTEFPVWVGVEGEVLVGDRFSFNGGYGYMPPPYADVVGSMAAAFSGNSNYKLLVTSMTQNNSAWKLAGNYHFSGLTGWLAGIEAYFFTASGQASIADVLEATTGQSYSNLISLLLGSGKNPTVFADSNFFIGEIHGGYTFRLNDHFTFRALLGVAKILSAHVALSSSSSSFDKSASGQAAYARSESQIENILLTYGISPTLKINLAYHF